MLRLEGKSAIISGAGTGIGLAIATLFRREGCRLVLADISGAQVDVAAELDAVPAHCDVSVSEDVRKACALAESTYGKVDIFVANAGVGSPPRMITDEDPATLDTLLSINTKGAWLAIHHAAPIMKRSGGGSIVLMASMAGLIGHVGMSAYAASKAGIIGLTVSAARELGPDGVRVNALCPGPTDTEKRRAFREANGLPLQQSADDLPIPLGRVARPAEVADAALFLAGDQSSFVTGVVLPVSGGQYS